MISGGRCGGIIFETPHVNILDLIGVRSFQLLVLLLSSLLQAHCDVNGSEYGSADLFGWRSLNSSAERIPRAWFPTNIRKQTLESPCWPGIAPLS